MPVDYDQPNDADGLFLANRGVLGDLCAGAGTCRSVARRQPGDPGGGESRQGRARHKNHRSRAHRRMRMPDEATEPDTATTARTVEFDSRVAVAETILSAAPRCRAPRLKSTTAMRSPPTCSKSSPKRRATTGAIHHGLGVLTAARMTRTRSKISAAAHTLGAGAQSGSRRLPICRTEWRTC